MTVGLLRFGWSLNVLFLKEVCKHFYSWYWCISALSFSKSIKELLDEVPGVLTLPRIVDIQHVATLKQTSTACNKDLHNTTFFSTTTKACSGCSGFPKIKINGWPWVFWSSSEGRLVPIWNRTNDIKQALKYNAKITCCYCYGQSSRYSPSLPFLV